MFEFSDDQTTLFYENHNNYVSAILVKMNDLNKSKKDFLSYCLCYYNITCLILEQSDYYSTMVQTVSKIKLCNINNKKEILSIDILSFLTNLVSERSKHYLDFNI